MGGGPVETDPRARHLPPAGEGSMNGAKCPSSEETRLDQHAPNSFRTAPTRTAVSAFSAGASSPKRSCRWCSIWSRTTPPPRKTRPFTRAEEPAHPLCGAPLAALLRRAHHRISARAVWRRPGRPRSISSATSSTTPRPQDQQCAGADPARPAHGQAAHHRRNGRRPAWRRHPATPARASGSTAWSIMGAVDVERQKPNVFRMKMLGATVVPVQSGARTLKDAMNEALRDWVTNVSDTFYCIGTAAGPHPIRPWCATSSRSSAMRPARRCWRRRGACPIRWSPASAAAPTPSACSTLPRRRLGRDLRRRGGRPWRRGAPTATPRLSPAASPACCMATALIC